MRLGNLAIHFLKKLKSTSGRLMPRELLGLATAATYMYGDSELRSQEAVICNHQV